MAMCSKKDVDLYLANVGLMSSADPSFLGAKFFAIGDLNNDKQNDIITVSDDLKTFSAHYFR